MPEKTLTKLNALFVSVAFMIIIGVGIYHLVTGAPPPKGTGHVDGNGRVLGFGFITLGVIGLSALVHRVRNEWKK